MLIIFGAGVTLGNMVGGRISNQNPSRVLIYLFLFHAVMLFILALVLKTKFMMVICLLLFGFFAYSYVPALQLLVVRLSARHWAHSQAA